MKKATARGELAERIQRNIARLDCDDYKAPYVFLHESGWPGDWPGRAILALCAQYESGGRSDGRIRKQIEEIFDSLPAYLNEDGYFGKIIEGPAVNEQQLSGNSWFIRGMCAWYRISRDRSVYERLLQIRDKFLPKIRPFFVSYPAKEHEGDAEVAGHIADESRDGWYLSSDVGCAFILLDGLTDLYTVLEDGAVYGLIETMIREFFTFDYIGCGFQTHAMLAATRAVVRLVSFTGDTRYLDAAERNFALYAERGTTVNYANFNWFRRPTSWTEPCGFVDSFILSAELYHLTGKQEYLKFANRVYGNAVRTAQRVNGGAGCETCLCEENGELKVYFYEANFCCTMRLADGLNYIRENSLIASDTDVFVLFVTGGEIETENFRVTVGYDFEKKKVELEILRGAPNVFLYLPEGVTLEGEGERSGCFAVLRGLSEGKYEFKLGIELTEETRNGKKVYFYADLLLTEKKYADDSPIGFFLDSKKLSPVGSCMQAEAEFGIDEYVQNI